MNIRLTRAVAVFVELAAGLAVFAAATELATTQAAVWTLVALGSIVCMRALLNEEGWFTRPTPPSPGRWLVTYLYGLLRYLCAYMVLICLHWAAFTHGSARWLNLVAAVIGVLVIGEYRWRHHLQLPQVYRVGSAVVVIAMVILGLVGTIWAAGDLRSLCVIYLTVGLGTAAIWAANDRLERQGSSIRDLVSGSRHAH